ncbi:unnamed protein product [Dracunculus medinensis]|uniref:V-SNARE coiled-coil homology domain-containing protein n=1 Tax=Dracunculus medinensis TaxID=318479 RepID=A0A0N4U6X6_DRAME|nr:unnamed protein product [Dracunculus medinensis]
MESNQGDRLKELQQEVSGVKTVIQTNVHRILERGDRLENLDGRAEALNQSSENFNLSARRVKRQLCRKNMKWSIIIAVGCTIVVLIVLFIILNDLGVFGH